MWLKASLGDLSPGAAHPAPDVLPQLPETALSYFHSLPPSFEAGQSPVSWLSLTPVWQMVVAACVAGE